MSDEWSDDDDDPIEMQSVPIADLDSVVAASLAEVTGYHVRAEGARSVHTMRFVGGGHFAVAYLDGRPTGYVATGVRFVRWDAETIEVSAYPKVS